jgi:hypothetical protein
MPKIKALKKLCQVELLSDADAVARHAETIHQLYLQTHHNARMRLVTLSPAFLPKLAEQLGKDLRCTIVRRDDQLLGFVTTVRDGETAVGYYIGFVLTIQRVRDLPTYQPHVCRRQFQPSAPYNCVPALEAYL